VPTAPPFAPTVPEPPWQPAARIRRAAGIGAIPSRGRINLVFRNDGGR
jgi:hypothetical protein